MLFKRKIYDNMLKWKSEQDGRTALLIKGARRVGKSTIVEDFARKEYKSYILIDFANISREVNSWFNDLSDLDYFFMRLQQFYKTELNRRKSVIIFDEIQLQPLARQAIKYLVKDGRYDYIETGSLLTLKKNVKDIVIPSEETRLTLYPMDYEEFMWAQGDNVTMQLIKDNLTRMRPFGDAV
ncbi:MAG: AAA family ATPase, partial [Prevotella sp.]